MFFTVIAPDGAVYQTNHVLPGYRESDKIPIITFSNGDRFVSLEVTGVSITLNRVAYPAKCCTCRR